MLRKDFQNNMPLLSGLFFTSLSLFVFQVVITRLFSAMMQYHYVFLLTSLAIFGSGLGGMLNYKISRITRTGHVMTQVSLWMLLLGVSYIVVFLLIFKLPYIHLILLYSALALIPYVIGGMIISSIFKVVPSQSHKLYFADLLGSALGSIAVIMMLNKIGITNTVSVIAALTSIASLCMAKFEKRKLWPIVPLLMLLGLGMTSAFQNQVTNFSAQFTGYFTSPSTSLARLRAADIDHVLKDWQWDAYTRADLIDDKTNPGSMIISMDGGANSQMLEFDGDLDKYQDLKKELNYLPFAVGQQERVLLIGSGGGKDVVLALLGESKIIDAVEISAASVELVRKYSWYNGDIYDRENVNVYVQDGRNFVKQSPYKYDTVYLAQVMTGTAETIGYALAENFIYTKEAIKDYWNVLEDNGRIAFIMHNEFDLNRITFTILESLRELGVPMENIGNHMVIVNRRIPGHEGIERVHMPLLMVQKSPFTQEQVGEITGLIAQDNHSILYMPYDETESIIRAYSEGRVILDDIYRQVSVNLFPTTDNRPFFFDAQKGIGPVLIILLAGVVVTALLFYRPLAGNRRLGKKPLYFIGLGIGFMLIEIPLMQKFSLLLGHPTRAFVIILTTLLVGGGIGSLAGGWNRFNWKRRYIPLVMVCILTIITNILASLFMNEWFLPSLFHRILLTVATLFPLGFFMGMPFPTGIKLVKTFEQEESIPLIWGINGIMSVGGSVLAVILSMKLGFSFSLATGAFIYLILFLFMPLYEKEKIAG